MADCSKTEVFFAEWKRMCEVCHEDCNCKFISCGVTAGCSRCRENVQRKSREAIEIVQEWSDEHPRKTRQSEFLEHYPNPHIIDGVLNICPFKVDINVDCDAVRSRSNGSNPCLNCMREYWLAEVE